MKPMSDKPNTIQGSISNPPPKAENKNEAPADDRSEAETQEQLTEAGPNEIEGRATNPFQKILDSLWGPIRG